VGDWRWRSLCKKSLSGPFSALLAPAKTIRKEPDLTERMVKAVVKSLYWIRANREASKALAHEPGAK
jgi:ABC-type nitrate/sulfonate/bicarbonate transport system substrate-binding protein